jgi:hypothetical protein
MHARLSSFREAPALAGGRFFLELISWVTIYFAWGLLAAVLAIAALLLFSVPGDKHVVPVRVPGAVRILLEILVAVAGVAAAWYIFARMGRPGVGLTVAGLLLLANVIQSVLAHRRWIWMLSR